ncbi:phage portal protein [Maritalea porphyrae]|uniref:Portal protein n=1 Tax=Maritalea porphyrae TaxID=880732 RepID=A0ABQ5UU80_9HYPH|nr:phage portal protein [Maritalea porphyrae]GLQ17939.1 portal protein [Maritalea porphyrae]
MGNFFNRLFGQRANSPAEHKSAHSFISMMESPSANWSGRSYAAAAQNACIRNPVAHRAISLVTQNAARVPLMVDDQGERLATHPVLDLLSRPNPDLSGPELIETIFSHLLLSGNAYLEVLQFEPGRHHIYPLRPDRVVPIVGQDGWIKAYDYKVGNTKRRIAASKQNPIPMIHLRNFHPTSDHSGLAPILAAMDAVDTHNKACEWHKSLLDNAARPSGALVYSAEAGNLTAEQFDRLKSELNASFQGAANAGRPMVLEGGLDWKTLSMSPRDMDFIEAKNSAARDIAMAFGVPPMLLCIAGDTTYANYKEANRAFWRQTIIPQMVKTCAALSRNLHLIFPGRWALVPNFEAIEAIADERLANWAKIDALNTLSEDEKRELIGLPKHTFSKTSPDLSDHRED